MRGRPPATRPALPRHRDAAGHPPHQRRLPPRVVPDVQVGPVGRGEAHRLYRAGGRGGHQHRLARGQRGVRVGAGRQQGPDHLLASVEAGQPERRHRRRPGPGRPPSPRRPGGRPSAERSRRRPGGCSRRHSVRAGGSPSSGRRPGRRRNRPRPASALPTAPTRLALPMPHNFSLDFMKPLRYGGEHGDSESGRAQPAGQPHPTASVPECLCVHVQHDLIPVPGRPPVESARQRGFRHGPNGVYLSLRERRLFRVGRRGIHFPLLHRPTSSPPPLPHRHPTPATAAPGRTASSPCRSTDPTSGVKHPRTTTIPSSSTHVRSARLAFRRRSSARSTLQSMRRHARAIKLSSASIDHCNLLHLNGLQRPWATDRQPDRGSSFLGARTRAPRAG